MMAALTALVLVAGATAGGVDWPQGRRDAANSAGLVADAPASETPRTWSFDGSGRVWGYQPGMTVWSSPALAVVDGRAIVAVGSYDHKLYCLDAASGAPLWTLTTGAAVSATPAIWRDGDGRTWMFIASDDRLVYAVDAADGRQRWVHSVEDYRPTLGGARLAAPAIGTVGDRTALFVGHWVWDSSLGNSLQRGGVVALDVADGKPLWRAQLGDNQMTAPVYARVGGRGRLFVGSGNGVLFALDADSGALLWSHAELDAVRAAPAFVEVGGQALVISASKFGTVRALDAVSGEQRWQHKTGDRITGSPAVYADGTRVVIGSYDRALYALDTASGELVWRRSVRGGIFSSPAVASDSDGTTVLASAWDDAVHAVDDADGALRFSVFTGRPLWNVAGMDESNWSSPVVARINGVWMVYAGSYDGTLRGLRFDAAASNPAPVRSNGLFWLSFPLALGPVAFLAVLLTRRDRQRRRRATNQ